MSGASPSGSATPYLPSSSDSVSPPVNWGWMESEVELACLQVTTVEWLLRQTLVSVHRNILRPVQVSLRKKKKSFMYPQWLPLCLLAFLHLIPVASISEQRKCYRPEGRGDLGTRDHHCCGGRSRCGRACRRDFHSGSSYGVGQRKPSYQGC
jgi:hypothetical protein